MNKLNRFSILFFVVILMLSCKKEGNFSAGETTNTSTCLLTIDSADYSSGYGDTFILTYDANGQLKSAVVDSQGVQIATVAAAAQQIVRTHGAVTETFDFTKNLFTGHPDSYTSTYSDNSSKNQKVNLIYKGGLLTQTQRLDGSGNPATTVDLDYNSSGDLMSISIGGSGASTVYKATNYDDKNSPYYTQAGANLLFYSWDYVNVSYTDLFTRLSHHNILEWTTTFGKSTTKAGYSYTYTNDLPTEVTISTQSADSVQTFPISYSHKYYTYDCK